MEWNNLSKIDASSQTGLWQQLDKGEFAAMVSDWKAKIPEEIPESYLQLRNNVVNAYHEAKIAVRTNKDYNKRKEYFTDLLFAFKFYQIMQTHGFSVRMASNDQVWMYLCVKVFPDIVHDRFPGSRIKTGNGFAIMNVNEDRFWKVRRRIYLKVLWWYIYLSVQDEDTGNFQAVLNLLKDNSTDEIVQIVERSGSAGYRVEVYREIMKYYSENRDKYDNETFRKIMVLNTARTKVVEPTLIDGGVSKYVKGLFDYVSE